MLVCFLIEARYPIDIASQGVFLSRFHLFFPVSAWVSSLINFYWVLAGLRTTFQILIFFLSTHWLTYRAEIFGLHIEVLLVILYCFGGLGLAFGLITLSMLRGQLVVWILRGLGRLQVNLSLRTSSWCSVKFYLWWSDLQGSLMFFWGDHCSRVYFVFLRSTWVLFAWLALCCEYFPWPLSMWNDYRGI